MTQTVHRRAILFRTIGIVLSVAMSVGLARGKEPEDPNLQRLYDYEASAKAMNQLAQHRLDDARSDLRKLGDRIASETVGKFYLPEHKGSDGYGYPGCYWEGCRDASCKLIAYARTDLDAVLNYRLTFITQARQKLDQELNDYVVNTERKRDLITQLRAEPAYVEAQAKRHDQLIYDVMQLADADYGHFCRFNYQLVLSAYVEEILLRLQEMTNSTGAPLTSSDPPSPLGIACQTLSELDQSEVSDGMQIEELRQAATQARGNLDWARGSALDAQADEKTKQCAAREQADLATMAAKLRELRDRFFLERSQIREQVLQWRQECIKQHFYDGEGDAAISRVYGGEADLSKETFANLHFSFDFGGATWPSAWDLKPPSATEPHFVMHPYWRGSAGDFLNRSNFVLHNDYSSLVWGANHLGDDKRYSLPGMTPPYGCQPSGPKFMEAAQAEYPDLCENRNSAPVPSCLAVSEYAPVIEGGVVSGTNMLERP